MIISTKTDDKSLCGLTFELHRGKRFKNFCFQQQSLLDSDERLSNPFSDLKTPMSAGYLQKKTFFSNFPKTRFKLKRSESDRTLPPVSNFVSHTGQNQDLDPFDDLVNVVDISLFLSTRQEKHMMKLRTLVNIFTFTHYSTLYKNMLFQLW